MHAPAPLQASTTRCASTLPTPTWWATPATWRPPRAAAPWWTAASRWAPPAACSAPSTPPCLVLSVVAARLRTSADHQHGGQGRKGGFMAAWSCTCQPCTAAASTSPCRPAPPAPPPRCPAGAAGGRGRAEGALHRHLRPRQCGRHGSGWQQEGGGPLCGRASRRAAGRWVDALASRPPTCLLHRRVRTLNPSPAASCMPSSLFAPSCSATRRL
jgi:hypothetical protein